MLELLPLTDIDRQRLTKVVLSGQATARDRRIVEEALGERKAQLLRTKQL